MTDHPELAPDRRVRIRDHKLGDLTKGYQFHRAVGLVVSSDPHEDQPLPRWKALKRAVRDFLHRGPELRRDDEVKYR